MINKAVLLRKKDIMHKFHQIPIVMVVMVLMLAFIGITMMYSAAGGDIEPWAKRQALHFALFIPLMFAVAFINLKTLFRISYILYFFTIILLVIIEFVGHTAMGATRWIGIGPMKIQPSEIMKLALIFVLARYYHTINTYKVTLVKFYGLPLALILFPFLLIAKQPDLGTAGILMIVGVTMIFMAGMRTKHIVIFSVIGMIALPLIWFNLYDFQKERIYTFLSPEHDPLGSGYNIIQSIIAIGSGGFSGKGLVQGTQSQLKFLPVHQTDFIFTMTLEELGFLGGLVIILMYIVIFVYCLFIATNAKSNFARLLAIGLTCMIFTHVIINMSMVLGLFPVVGIPLPLLSYGGTITMTTLVGLGLILNVHINQNSYIPATTISLL